MYLLYLDGSTSFILGILIGFIFHLSFSSLPFCSILFFLIQFGVDPSLLPLGMQSRCSKDNREQPSPQITADHDCFPSLCLLHFFFFSLLQLRTDAEKRSLVESGLSWYSEDGKASHKLSSSAYDTGSLKTEAPSKWRKKPPSLSEEAGFRGELKKPQSLGHPGAFKKGRNPPVGVTSPITHTSQSTLKVAGEIRTVFSLRRSQNNRPTGRAIQHTAPVAQFIFSRWCN